tara:strand:+ start:431 stop:895 length:465 start_codon:yes stop_codon:yes gene_type:complete
MASTKVKKQRYLNYTSIGWREWVYLPKYNDFAIKAKVDTGARTSAIHATHIEEYKSSGKKRVRFRLHQLSEKIDISTNLLRYLKITSSFGDSEIRPLIRLKIRLGDRAWFTEVTLTTRTRMTYPMLIGRNSLMKKYLIHSHKSYLTGKNKLIDQ